MCAHHVCSTSSARCVECSRADALAGASALAYISASRQRRHGHVYSTVSSVCLLETPPTLSVHGTSERSRSVSTPRFASHIATLRAHIRLHLSVRAHGARTSWPSCDEAGGRRANDMQRTARSRPALESSRQHLSEGGHARRDRYAPAHSRLDLCRTGTLSRGANASTCTQHAASTLRLVPARQARTPAAQASVHIRVPQKHEHEHEDDEVPSE